MTRARHEPRMLPAADVTDFVTFQDRFEAAARAGVVEPEFCPDGSRFRFTDAAGRWEVDLAAGSKVPVTSAEAESSPRSTPRNVRKGFFAGEPGPDEVPSPNGAYLLGEQGPNLALRAVVDDRQHLLTRDGAEDDAWDVGGATWSPDSLQVLATRRDTRRCAKVPLVAWLQTEEQVELHPWTRVGCVLPSVTAAVIDVRSRRVREIELPGEDDQTILPAGWRHDGSEAYVLTTDRRRKYLRLYAVGASSGQARLVCEEAQATFVLGIRDVDRFAPELILADDERLLWFSERDGWRHLYLYRTDGTELGRVTSGELEVLKVLGVDLASETVYLTAHCDLERPYDVHVCRVGLDGSGFVQLTTQPGLHEAVLTPGKTHVLDTHSALDRPPSTDLLRVDGTFVTSVATADLAGLAQLDLGTAEPFTALAADGVTELHGVLYLPPRFDAAKSYPVIENQYGGPQVAVHQVGFIDPLGKKVGPIGMAIASQGFVTFTVDGRGTPGRGKSFQDVVYGRFGQFHVEDHAHVLEQLLERYPFMDADRVGVTGCSWGGYNTVRALLLAPELYKVGVAVCPVYDLDDHLSFALEPYMGLPADRPEAFAAGSSLACVDRLQGKLLLIHGTSDVNATFSATMKMCDALARADKPYDLVVLPEADHHFKNAGAHPWRFKQASMIRYFLEHLGEPE